MKCWLIKKIIFLYVGNDINLAYNLIRKHLLVCPECRRFYSQCRKTHNILKSIKNEKIPDSLLNNYWEEISFKINQNKQPKLLGRLTPFSLKPSFVINFVLSFAIITILVSMIYYTNSRINNHIDIIDNKTYKTTALSGTTNIVSFPAINKKRLRYAKHNLKKYKKINILKIQEIEYKLEEVELLNNSDNITF